MLLASPCDYLFVVITYSGELNAVDSTLCFTNMKFIGLNQPQHAFR